jgi:class 3 adenylate cyclase
MSRGGSVAAWGYADVTVCFADIVDFTRMCAELTPLGIASLLDEFFGEMDALCERHRLKYIKTIGDAYMLAGGLIHGEDVGHAERVVAFALDALRLAGGRPDVQDMPFGLRIGMATGPVVAGVLRGNNRVHMDLWGDTVNVASRLCALAEPMALSMDELTYLSLTDPASNCGEMSSQRVNVKGRGEVMIYRTSAFGG